MKAALAITLLAAAAAATYAAMQSKGEDQTDDEIDDPHESAGMIDEITAAIKGRNWTASEAVKAKLKASEGLKLQPYQLNDGGWTVGYGHWESTRAALPILKNQADANALFDRDVYGRAEKWVNAYITIDLAQHEYDALVHVAYNMSPRSFKKFAAAVNEGQGIESVAAQSINWVASEYRNGISNRRAREIAMFNQAIYA
jgi:lysozyme